MKRVTTKLEATEADHAEVHKLVHTKQREVQQTSENSFRQEQLRQNAEKIQSEEEKQKAKKKKKGPKKESGGMSFGKARAGMMGMSMDYGNLE